MNKLKDIQALPESIYTGGHRSTPSLQGSRRDTDLPDTGAYSNSNWEVSEGVDIQEIIATVDEVFAELIWLKKWPIKTLNLTYEHTRWTVHYSYYDQNGAVVDAVMYLGLHNIRRVERNIFLDVLFHEVSHAVDEILTHVRHIDDVKTLEHIELRNIAADRLIQMEDSTRVWCDWANMSYALMAMGYEFLDRYNWNGSGAYYNEQALGAAAYGEFVQLIQDWISQGKVHRAADGTYIWGGLHAHAIGRWLLGKVRTEGITNPDTLWSIHQEVMQYTQEGLAEAGQTAFFDPDTTSFSDEALIAVARRSEWVKTGLPPTITTAQQARNYFKEVRDGIFHIADQKGLTIEKYEQIRADLNSNKDETPFHNQLGIFVPYVMQLCMFYNPEDNVGKTSITNALNQYCPTVMRVIQEKTGDAQSGFMSALLNWGKQAGRMVNECEWLVTWATGWAKYDPIGAVEDETARSIDDYTKNPARVPLLETQSAINRHDHDFIYERLETLFRNTNSAIPEEISSINSAANALNELANIYGNGSASSSTSEQIDADTLFSKTQQQHDRDTDKMKKVQFTRDRAANRFKPLQPVDPSELAQFMIMQRAEMVQRMLLEQVYKDAPQGYQTNLNSFYFPTEAQRQVA